MIDEEKKTGTRGLKGIIVILAAIAKHKAKVKVMAMEAVEKRKVVMQMLLSKKMNTKKKTLMKMLWRL